MKALPKSLGACADLLFDLREKRLKAERQVEAMRSEEARLKDHIINALPKGDTGARGRHHQVAVVTATVPRVVDWDRFHQYIKRTGAFELLQRRVADAAVAERWDDRKTVPGVEPHTIVKVSLTKI